MTEPVEIKGFKGQHRWLSNFYKCKLKYEGVVYPSSEHAYQAAKSNDDRVKSVIAQLPDAKTAKRFGQSIEKRPDWEEVKEAVMLDILREKFRSAPLKNWLDSTGDAFLEETNNWGDVFWGVCDGVGANKLGQILMQVRSENRE